MISLFIDTSTEHGVIGIFRNGLLIKGRELPFGFSHSKELFPAIVELTSSCGLSPKNFDYIAVGAGPGSYTGIRVSASIAKALSCSLDIPLIGVSSLHGFVAEDVERGSFIGIVDARIGGFYTIVGEIIKNEVKVIEEEKLSSLAEIKERISSFSYIVTPTKELIIKRLSIDVSLTVIEQSPSLKQLGSRAYFAYMQGEGSKDGKVSLLYLRKTQAEIEKEKISIVL